MSVYVFVSLFSYTKTYILLDVAPVKSTSKGKNAENPLELTGHTKKMLVMCAT